MQTYKTIKGTATAQIEEKKSRFIANISFADTEAAALCFLSKIRTENPSANHNVYAYVLNDGTVRCSDDKEPSKTAGAPVLNVLQSACITDAIIVVTRYFGGTLLGTGGLIRAYEKSAKAALEKAE
ncbi:MAG: YigZ family protein, partial [Oscillospiraceae bacterium]